MKRIFSLRVIIPVAALLLSISLYSCSENPLVPPIEEPFELDSARFDWEIDTLQGYGILFNCLYAIDTNDVYLLNIYQEYLLNIKDEKKIYYYFNDFYSSCLKGKDDQIYIGGSRLVSASKFVPHIKKFNNGTFQDIYFPGTDTMQNDFVKSIYVNKIGTIWALTGYYFVKIEGSKFTFYRIPLIESYYLSFSQILEDQSNSLKAFGLESKWEGIYLKDYSYIFEFKNDHWELIWQNTWKPSTEKLHRMSVLNVRILSSNNNEIFEFNGENFIRAININIPQVYVGTIVGSSYNDFLFTGYIPHMGPLIIHWNGNQSSLEFLNPHYEPIPYSLSKDKFWVILNDRDISQILICKGTRKK
jgi:hypothetical protein